MNIKAYFSKLPAKNRQWIVIGGAVAALLFVLMFFTQDEDRIVRVSPKTDRSVNVLTDQKRRNLGMDAIASRVNSLATENKRLRDEVERLSKDISDTRSNDALERQMRERFEKMSNEISRLREAQSLSGPVQAFSDGNQQGGNLSDVDGNPFIDPSVASGTTEMTGSLEPMQSGGNATPTQQSKKKTEAKKSAPKQLIVVSEDDKPSYSSSNSRNARKKKDAGTVNYIPAGSILTGTLITGGDFPTGSGGKDNPMPILVRLTKTAILPNRFQSDVRECFMLMSGHGDLSSERAKFRGETLSCVRHDGGVIQTKLSSYVAGEDGKEGIKGRLVSKQGQMIARTLVAGFLSGISDAFDYTPVEVLSTTSSGSVQYQKNFSADAVKSGLATGASNAAEKVADFYAKLADSMVPVVEITPGRQVDIVVVSGTKIDPKVSAKLSTSGTGSINN